MHTPPHDAPWLASLPEIEHALWQDLTHAAVDRQHPWRAPCLMTLDAQAPDGRVVVLRQVNAARGTLTFYTDARSPKVWQIQSHAGGMLLFWNPRRSLQLRMRCSLAVATSGSEVAAAWEQVKHTRAAGDYLSALAPGEQLAGKPSVAAPAGSGAGPETGPHHLAIITAQVDHMDWLELARSGHRRAGFSKAGAVWLQC